MLRFWVLRATCIEVKLNEHDSGSGDRTARASISLYLISSSRVC
uniref:Uncharacterized protein n=1 Tax=Arundo donax TaxID=35708 RepID=A0A0A9B0Y3_ARUDO